MTNQKIQQPVTKQLIKTSIRRCARKLGHPPTRSEFAKMTGISRYFVEKQFGGLHRALKICGMKPSRENRRLKLPELFSDWANVARKLNHLPTITEYRKLGRYNEFSLRRRFRSWHEVGRHFREYVEKERRTREWRDVLAIIASQKSARCLSYLRKPGRARLLLDRRVYGPVLHSRQLAHGPVNESGVVYLFGAMAERLGFVVMYIQNGFPDCEAMRRIDRFRWQRIFIEFEYESRNYRRHRHPKKGCDLIVCWKHNWPECPLEVLELSKLALISGNSH